jgi:hypothetical protein
MALFSAFLMARMLMLGAFCPWCALSALLSGALGVLALVDLAQGRQSLVPAGCGVALAAGMVALTLLTGGHRPVPPAGDPARLEAIARHLSASDARFYGVWWCERCREQKELFGAAALELPYIESSRVVPEGIEEFPTWEIGGRRITGVLSPDSLAELSGYTRSP